ncbi:Type 1 membrane protein [Quillaja saponaria]|uniref:Type 1 membrane protein n=1 Tax=Quillaja saponaria TaxID=32244 RepID=A0AAD7VL27_QUISA|nr:Type 1 membrane protein [Quillaja saponaria]
MEFGVRCICRLLIIFPFLLLQARAEGTGSALFIDAATHKYFRAGSDNDAVKLPSLSLQEVSAAVSVLLGFAPPPTLSAAGSSKLNEVLVPNPFNRPRAVVLLEVSGLGDFKQIDPDNAMLSSGPRSTNIIGSDKADIQLPDEDEVSMISLDEQLGDCTDKDISDFASWMGGSYVTDSPEPLNGLLSIPLGNGASVNLHMSNKADREFTLGLLSLVRNVRRAGQMHEDLFQSIEHPAELLSGCFHGIKILQEHYGHEGVSQHGIGLLFATLTKIFDSLQEAYKGQIVGVIHFYTSPGSGKKFNVMSTSRPAARWLDETKSVDTSIQQLILVRRTLAWLTGVILLVSTLLGIYFLFNMPITRDTLLYSNVKLD